MTVVDYIEQRIGKQAGYHSKRACRSQLTYRRFQTAAIILGALTPLLLAFNLLLVPPAKQFGQYVFTLMPIMAAVSLTVVQSFLSTYQYKDHWLESRATKEALDQELYLYRLGAGPYQSVANADALLVERCETIIGTERDSWVSAIKSSSQTTGAA